MEMRVSPQMIDIYNPEHEVEVLHTEGRLWVNVDGVCRLRIYGIKPETFKLSQGENNDMDRPGK